MRTSRPPFEDFNQERLEARIRDVARRLFADKKVDDLETWHLVQVVEHCSRAISDIYRTVNLDQILRGTIQVPRLGGEWVSGEADSRNQPLGRMPGAPEELRGIADRCLYDIGMAGVLDYRGLSLETLGVRSYEMAADILSVLANERDLRELFQRNRMRSLPIEEEVAFLRQCSARFNLYARLLATLRNENAAELAASEESSVSVSLGHEPQTGFGTREKQESLSSVVRLSRPGEPRERTLSRFERILLFADTDLESVREELNRLVVDQQEAVDAICEDLLLNAMGTQIRGVPHSYFLVGPTGVGKNHLMESLARVLESRWGVEIPFLVIEGPQYTYPSDVQELRGATRGFIRSDEPGILTAFHDRSSRAPLSILLIDEVEKAHPQLPKFFLSIMDRGTVHDNRGQELSFEGTLLVFTSNLGYAVGPSSIESIGYRGGSEEKGRRQQVDAERTLHRDLPPEFLSRLRTIRFSPLTPHSMDAILELEVAKVFKRFHELHGLEITLTAAARLRLLELGFSPAYGARHLGSVVRRYCNVEVGRQLRRDRITPRGDRGGAVRYVREIKEGERAFDSESVEWEVLRHARVEVPYSHLIIDFHNGEFEYQGESK